MAMLDDDVSDSIRHGCNMPRCLLRLFTLKLGEYMFIISIFISDQAQSKSILLDLASFTEHKDL